MKWIRLVYVEALIIAYVIGAQIAAIGAVLHPWGWLLGVCVAAAFCWQAWRIVRIERGISQREERR